MSKSVNYSSSQGFDSLLFEDVKGFAFTSIEFSNKMLELLQEVMMQES